MNIGVLDLAANAASFDEEAYLRRYPDVAAAVGRGDLPSGQVHWELHGREEGRSGAPFPTRPNIPRWWIDTPTDRGRLGNYDRRMAVRTISDMNRLICRHLPKLASWVDLVVGVPRSGLLAANMIALHLNRPLMTLDAFLKRQFDTSKFSHRTAIERISGDGKSRVLIVDDSVGTGRTLLLIQQGIDNAEIASDFDVRFLAIYATTQKAQEVDHLEIVNHPRAFEWNVLHHDYTRYFCVDLDGVLCADPMVDENDDGPAYLHFLKTAKLRVVPSCGVGAIVTARLERYRPETERWLEMQGISYDRLIMLDLPSGAERRRLGAHGRFKADVYLELGGRLFVESDPSQSREIFDLTGLPVYCTTNSTFLS